MFVYITASKVNKFRYIEYSTDFSTLSTYGGHASICCKKRQKRDKNRVNCQYFGQNRYKTRKNLTICCKSAFSWGKM